MKTNVGNKQSLTLVIIAEKIWKKIILICTKYEHDNKI